MFNTTALYEAQTAYNQALDTFNKDLEGRLEFHNTIVKNLALKFNSELTPKSVIISAFSLEFSAADFVRENETTIVFRDKTHGGSNRTIPKYLLHNDPMLIAQYVRKKIRKLQISEREHELREAEKRLNTVRNNRIRAEETEKTVAQTVDEARRVLMRKLNKRNEN